METIKVYLLSLGCAKNLVNSEQMLAKLREVGFLITESPEDADVAVVNTCGFIDSAKSEAIEALLQLAEYKKEGSLKALVAAGCLAQRYGKEFAAELPEVDAVLGAGAYSDIVEAVRGVLSGRRVELLPPPENEPLEGRRCLLTPQYSAYIRIAEGCDNRCAYCVIPYIRGRYRSRRREDILAEAKELAANGTRELLVVAQDITRYGTDLYGKRELHTLLSELCRIDGLEWIRLHYLYPDEIDDELIDVCASEPKILHYFDLPIQHISDRILARMNRRGGSAAIKSTITKIREKMPDAVIRTSIIVGFPGETEADFEELCEFSEQFALERAGVFCYSQEEGSPAAEFEDQVPEEIKEQRRETLYSIQERIMESKSEAVIGKTLRVLCCGADERGYLGRTYMDSPDVDGTVIFTGDGICEGEFYDVKITGCEACDLYGAVGEEA